MYPQNSFRLFSLAALFGVSSIALACNDAPKSDTKKSEAMAPKAEVEAKGPAVKDQLISGTHSVTCGCTLEQVGHCSEYIEVDGQYVELQLPESAELGKMPFCGKENLKAVVEGALKDGKVIANTLLIQEG